jgi:hypothetical protein
VNALGRSAKIELLCGGDEIMEMAESDHLTFSG